MKCSYRVIESYGDTIALVGHPTESELTTPFVERTTPDTEFAENSP